jgi:hypothetical protein
MRTIGGMVFFRDDYVPEEVLEALAWVLRRMAPGPGSYPGVLAEALTSSKPLISLIFL